MKIIKKKKLFEVEKSDSMAIEMLFNTVLSFQTISTRTVCTGSFMFSYFNKCFTNNTIEKSHSVTPCQDDQTIENFDYSQGEWLTSLLPSNSFETQKEWVTNIMCKPYSMKVKDFHNCIKSFNCFWPWCLMTTHILLLQILTSRLYCWCLCHYLGRILTCLKVHVHLMIFIKCFNTLSNPSALEIAKWLLKPSFLLPQYTVVRDSFHMVVLDVADLAIQHLAVLVVARTPALIIKQILALIVFFGLSRPLSCSSYSHQLKH